jgi:hypothetical protein
MAFLVRLHDHMKNNHFCEDGPTVPHPNQGHSPLVQRCGKKGSGSSYLQLVTHMLCKCGEMYPRIMAAGDRDKSLYCMAYSLVLQFFAGHCEKEEIPLFQSLMEQHAGLREKVEELIKPDKGDLMHGALQQLYDEIKPRFQPATTGWCSVM